CAFGPRRVGRTAYPQKRDLEELERGLLTAERWPREESNLRTRIRSPSLYPLSYGAVPRSVAGPIAGLRRRDSPGDNRRGGGLCPPPLHPLLGKQPTKVMQIGRAHV